MDISHDDIYATNLTTKLTVKHEGFTYLLEVDYDEQSVYYIEVFETDNPNFEYNSKQEDNIITKAIDYVNDNLPNNSIPFLEV